MRTRNTGLLDPDFYAEFKSGPYTHYAIRMRILITIFLQALSPPVCTYLLCIPRVFHLPALGILDDSSSPRFLIIFSFFLFPGLKEGPLSAPRFLLYAHYLAGFN